MIGIAVMLTRRTGLTTTQSGVGPVNDVLARDHGERLHLFFGTVLSGTLVGRRRELGYGGVAGEVSQLRRRTDRQPPYGENLRDFETGDEIPLGVWTGSRHVRRGDK